MRKLKVGEKYCVKWLDTFDYSGWWTEEDLISKAHEMTHYIETIGYFVAETKQFYILCNQKNKVKGFSPWAHPVWIPRGCVASIKKI